MSFYRRIGLFIIFCLTLFAIVGCKTLDETKPIEGTHLVRDSTGATVQIPDHPTRIVPIGVSTEDMVISLVDRKSVV